MQTIRELAGPACGRRFEQEYHGKNNRDCLLFYYDGRLRFERYCYGEAASLTFGVWAAGMDAEGNINWDIPAKGYCEPAALPRRLTKTDGEVLYCDDARWKWTVAGTFAQDKANGYPRWKVLLGRSFRR